MDAPSSPDTVDRCFAALLADPRTDLRPLADGMTMERYRELMDRPLRAIEGPQLHAVDDLAPDATAALRVYRPSDEAALPVILFFHGGGFVMGSLETHDAMCRTLAGLTGAVVIAVAYRLAPEASFPQPLEDCHAALCWVAASGAALGIDTSRIALCGDSAGGNLAFAAALLARERGPAIAHVGLLYPVVDPGCDTVSQHRFATGHMLTREAMRWFWASYLGAGGNPADPLAAIATGDLAGLPPVSILTAAFDPLCDEGALLADRIAAARGDVKLRCYPGMIHGFASLPMLTPVADMAMADLARDLRKSVSI